MALVVHPEFYGSLAEPADSRATRSMALVVHPEFYGTLAEPAVCTRVTWERNVPSCVGTLILSKLGAQDLLQLSRTSKSWRRAAREDALWRTLCRKKFGTCIPADAEPPSWQELYKFNHRLLMGILAMERPKRELPSLALQLAAPGQPILLQAWN